MSWKAIGASIIGTGHIQQGKGCEDAVAYELLETADGPVLLCCVSDGAGSARHAAYASSFVTRQTVTELTTLVQENRPVDEAVVFGLAESLYEALTREAAAAGVPVNEYSCTWLGGVIYPEKAVFFQIGDGAIVRDDGTGYYTNLWWPHNGEYQNSTSFLIDDPHFAHLHVTVLEEAIGEAALFSDGLQLLALSMETASVHQPFFTGLFRVLRMADEAGKIATLNRKLGDYLGSDLINGRTDDDKTLFLATRLPV